VGRLGGVGFLGFVGDGIELGFEGGDVAALVADETSVAGVPD
jgi:hypothetical protein